MTTTNDIALIKRTVTEVATRYKVSPSIMLSILSHESSNGTDLGKAGGLFQINQNTYNELAVKYEGFPPGTVATLDVETQAEAATIYFKNLLNSLKDQDAAIVSYNLGPEGGPLFLKYRNQGMDPYAANTMASQTLATKNHVAKWGDPNYLRAIYSNLGAVPTPSSPALTDLPPADFVPLASEADELIAYANLQTDESNSLYISDGLDTTPWYSDPSLVVGNPSLKQSTPISFSINLREFSNSNALPTSKGGTDTLTVRLNCGVSDLSVSMKHIINKTNSRTGFHMTFWGMEPDTITGSGSTGVFMNQYGMTEIMSLSNFPDDLANTLVTQLSTDQLSLRSTGSAGQLRVAAQDAFVELLSLFRNNGIVRYKQDNYDAATSQIQGRNQVQKSIWSEKYGGSSYTRLARLNDIMVKGNVVMRFKSNVYHGYFKSLSWVMDADHPFHWKFDFTFQVQKTVSLAFIPKATA